MNKEFGAVDFRAIRYMHQHGLTFLRYALGIVFIWFGALKIFGVSPVADLVAMTVYWFPPNIVVPALGFWEVIIGLGLLFYVSIRLTLVLFWLQMLGTLLVLVIRPDVAFQNGNPLLLTTVGEFVIKNLVLITAGIAIGGTIRTRKR